MPVALTRGGHALGHFAGDLDGGIALLDRALVLNPNLAAAWFLGGFLRIWLGEPESAIEHFARAMRLSPLDPEMYRMQAGMAMAHLLAGRFDERIVMGGESHSRDLPSFLMVVGDHCGEPRAGRPGRAKRSGRCSTCAQLDPALRVSNLRDWLPIHRPEDLATFADGLRKSGPAGRPRRFRLM